MAVSMEDIRLEPDEFALYFETDRGVEASVLADFLKRTATVARQRSGELQVVGFRDGSLAVILRVINKSKLGQAASKEFYDKPIDTTVKASGFAATVVGAIIFSMYPGQGKVTPLAKAGADLIEKESAKSIKIISNTTNVIVMNEAIASEIRKAEKSSHQLVPKFEHPSALSQPVITMIEDAHRGELTGDATLVGGEIHFRPDGYRYWVPVTGVYQDAQQQLYPDGHFRVSGHIETKGGQPDRIVIIKAVRIR